MVFQLVGRIDQSDGQRGHKPHRVNALVFDKLEDLLKIKTTKNDVLAADQGEDMRDAPAVGMKQGNRMKLSKVPRGVKGQANTQGMQVNISMRQHHAFGIGAGATGVKELGYRVLVNCHDVCLTRLSV